MDSPRYRFEWDPQKAKTNLKKHKVSFEQATEIFIDPFMISVFDTDHSIDEERWVTIGKDKNDVTLVAIHTFYEENKNVFRIRLISARRAVLRERKQYKERDIL